MFHAKFSLGTIAALATLILILGCSGSGLPVAPSSAPGPIQSLDQHHAGNVIGYDSPRTLWGLYTITVGPDFELSVEPLRDAEAHMNLTSFLLPPKCNYCLKLNKTGVDQTAGWIAFDVSLANPTKIAGRDVRGIILGDENYYLMNPDALTPYAGPVVYDSPNGFKAYATDQTDNIFPADGNPTNPTYFKQNFKIKVPTPWKATNLLKIKYAVDVSYPTSCLDPWYIADLTLPGKLYEGSPSMDFTIDIRDHQNNIKDVTLDSPAGWLGTAPTLTKVDSDTWSGKIGNCAGNAPGRYRFYVTATSNDTSTPPKALALYKELFVVIDDFACITDPKNQPSGAPKLALKGDVYDIICSSNPHDYFTFDFNDASMQAFGVLSGDITLASCTPGLVLDLVYYDQTADKYFDGTTVTADSNGTATLPIHIPNSVKFGKTVELTYVKVNLPVTGSVDAPYRLTTNLTYETSNCGDALSLSTVGAPEVPFAGGMIQGVLCDPNRMDFYHLKGLGPSAEMGRLTGNLTVSMEYPDPLPPDAVTGVSLRDEDGTILVNFDQQLPPSPQITNIADLDLPSTYDYYICMTNPLQTSTDVAYKITWSIAIDDTCAPDKINLTNSAPLMINPEKTSWNYLGFPGSAARMWLCNPDDLLDGYPFVLPPAWSSEGKTLGGTMRVQSDSASFGDVRVSIGLENLTTKKFAWFSPKALSGVDNTFDLIDLAQAPLDFGIYQLEYWLKVEDAGSGNATAQVENDMSPSIDCGTDTDDSTHPTGSFELGSVATSMVVLGTDTSDYWDLDWQGNARLKGDIGVKAAQNVRIGLYQDNFLLTSSEGSNPSINVNAFDLGAGCAGPIVKIEPLGGSIDQCVQYFLSGLSLTEPATCDNNPDDNETFASIASKPWMWLSPNGGPDSVCGVVCREGSNVDNDTIGLNGPVFETQGSLFGYVSIFTNSPDGHQIEFLSMDDAMKLTSSSLTPPFYQASIELDTYNLPVIPPKGWTYYVRVTPDPTPADSLVPYTCQADFGSNTELPFNDGHDLQSEAWPLQMIDARLGMLSYFGETSDIDSGAPDLADWFRIDGLVGEAGKYLTGTIKLDCEKEDVTVRLMAEGQLAASGTALYEGTIETGNDNLTLTIPPGVLPSIPDAGTHYYIVVHNNGIPGWASYGLTLNLQSQ